MLRICIKNLILGLFLAALIFLQGIEAFRTQIPLKNIYYLFYCTVVFINV